MLWFVDSKLKIYMVEINGVNFVLSCFAIFVSLVYDDNWKIVLIYDHNLVYDDISYISLLLYDYVWLLENCGNYIYKFIIILNDS